MAKKIYRLHDYDQHVEELFIPRRLVRALGKMVSSGGAIFFPERYPAGHLFAGMTVRLLDGSSSVWELSKGGVVTGYVEAVTNGSCLWRWRNHVDRTKATMVYDLVPGNTNVELVDYDLELEVDTNFYMAADGISYPAATITNNSKLNGVAWDDFTPVKYVDRIGWMYTLNNVQEANSWGGLIYLPWTGQKNYNQAGNLKKTLTIVHEKLRSLFPAADYYVRQVDLDDVNDEKFGCQLAILEDGNPKASLPIQFISLKTIFSK